VSIDFIEFAERHRAKRLFGCTGPSGDGTGRTVTVLGAGDDPIVAPVSSATSALTSGSGSPAEPVAADADPNVDPDVIDPGSGPIQGDECTDDTYRDH
jgi:hypothetical protein